MRSRLQPLTDLEDSLDQALTCTISKKDKNNHGFGMKNIENVVKKYDGDYTYGKENNDFWAEVRVKNNRSSKK